MENKTIEFAVVETVEEASETSAIQKEDIVSQPKKKRPKTKICPVVNYVSEYGIVGFYFDGIPCQIMVKPGTKIGRSITVKYDENPKTGIHFWL